MGTGKKTFRCQYCSKDHDVFLDADLVKNKGSYPFAHIYLHKLENSDNVEEIGCDILTTLYLDAELRIRGVELKKLVVSDIMSKNDSKSIMDQLMEEIARLQDENNELRAKLEAMK